MTLWSKEASEKLPEFRKELQEEKLVHCFLHFVYDRLVDAYKNSNYERIERIKDYIFTLANANPGSDATNDLATIVTVSFFEHLPESKLIRQDIGRWFSAKEIRGMNERFLLTMDQKHSMKRCSQPWKNQKEGRSNQALLTTRASPRRESLAFYEELRSG